MRVFLTAVAVALMPAAAWAGLGLPNELVDPGFEAGAGAWEIDGGAPILDDHWSYAVLAPLGIPAAPGGGSYCGGAAGQSVSFGGGILRQIVDESEFPGWDPDLDQKLVELEFDWFQVSLADVPMTLNVYLDYMEDGSEPVPGAPGYVQQQIDHIENWNSGGWQHADIEVLLDTQPRYLSVEFEFTYFGGTGANLIDNVDLQGQCVPEPATLSLLALGALTLIRRRR